MAAPAAADVTFNNFSNPAGLNLIGDAQVAGTTLELVPDANNDTGAAWFQTKQAVGNGFSTQFTFAYGTGGGGEGMAFVIQNVTSSELGAGQCGLGYDGITNSLAIEFDTVGNATCGGQVSNEPSNLHISIQTRGGLANSSLGTFSLGSAQVVNDFANGSIHIGRIEYTPGLMKVFVDILSVPVLQVPLDLDQLLALSGDDAYVGFTAATSNSSEVHKLFTWMLSETPPTTSGNTPPAAPPINEPGVDGQEVNPGDVHMEAGPFFDADGDQHECSDWEVWTLSPLERVWYTSCIGGVERLHTHIGDGTFVGSHAGRSDFFPSTDFALRVRFKDDSGDPVSEWGPWSERTFVTGAASTIFPLELEDVGDAPPPQIRDPQGGTPVALPGGPNPPSFRIESSAGDLLVEWEGFDGVTNILTNPPELSEHVDARLVIEAGGSGLNISETDLFIADAHCDIYNILVPAISLGPFQTDYFWIASSGYTYDGLPGQTTPDFSSLARGNSSVPWQTFEAGFEVDVFAGGLQMPTNIVFVPNAGPNPGDPFLYVTELYGTIKVVTRDGTVSDYATNLLNYTPSGAFPGSGEQGMAGLALDPVSGDLFVSMLYDGGPANYPKVVRLSSTDGGMTASTQTTLLDMAGESQGQSHFISTVNIWPDGSLYVHMGDGFNAGTAQDLNSYRGKILRMNLDGSPHASNPMYNPGNGINSRDYIFAHGVRNPFGGDRRASDGELYKVGNGPSVDRLAKVTEGMNMGWNGSDFSMQTNALYNWIPAKGPVNIAFVQPETFNASGFPEYLHGQAFVTESGPTWALGPQVNGKRIVRFELDTDGTVLSGPTKFLEYGGSGRATAVGLEAGPDGLYFTDFYNDSGPFPTATGGRILRIRFDSILDCNSNGHHDLCDIASGVSQDVNGNEIPDECECAATSFCSSLPNSTGAPALISQSGSCIVSSNDFTLSAAPVPDQPGIFFFADAQVNGGNGVPFYDGLRCVGGGTLYRLGVTTGSGNVATDLVDFTTGNGAFITGGSTWHLQYWFRDPLGGPSGANLSDAITVPFQ